MKLSRCVLLALLGVLSVSGVIAGQREVRTYTNEMEYVDDVQQHATPPGAALATEPEYASPLARVVADAAAMMETEAASAYDAYATRAEEEALNLSSFLESESSAAAAAAEQLSDVDTQVARAMAVEIHEHAQAMLEAEEEQGAQMLVEMSTEAEAEVEAEAEAEADSSADAELLAEAELEAEVEAEVDAELDSSSAVSADPAGLSSEELAQEMMDRAADKADRVAEQADKKEEAKDAAKARQDGIPIGVVPKVVVAPASASAPPKTVVQLPEDLSLEHQRALRANTAATSTVRGALGEVGAILASKDDTIRSLVANISYLTVNTGKLANQIDRQRAYIRLLQDKLQVAGLKDRELRAHVSQSADTVLAVRAQLAAVEKRLNKQGQTTNMLAKFLNANEDDATMPPLSDNIEVRGTPVKKLKAAAAKRRAHKKQKQQQRRSNLRPVSGTQTRARPARAGFHIGSFFNGPAVAAPLAAHMPTHYNGRVIPTIIVEETDDGR